MERKLTFKEYVTIGEECKKIEKTLLNINKILHSGELPLKKMDGITGKGNRSFSSEAFMIQKKMMMMKGAFDDNLARDYPEEFNTNIFYER